MFQLHYVRCATWSKVKTWHTKLTYFSIDLSNQKKGSYFDTSKKKAHKTLVMDIVINVSWNVCLLFHSFIDSFSDSVGLIHPVINLKYCVVFIEYSRIFLNPLPEHSFLSSTLMSYLYCAVYIYRVKRTLMAKSKKRRGITHHDWTNNKQYPQSSNSVFYSMPS